MDDERTLAELLELGASGPTLIDVIASTTATSGPLTEQDVRAAIDGLRDAPYEPDPCKLGKHVVSPAARDRGYGICAVCQAPVGDWPVRP